jgi:outer membrane protein TolC
MKKIIFIIFTGIITQIQAQTIDTSKTDFTLKEAQEYALQNNKQILNSRLDIIASKKKVWESTAMGLPQVNASLSHNYNIDLPITLMPAQIFNPQAPEGEYMEMKFGTDHNTKFNLQVTQLIFSGQYIVGLRAAKIYQDLVKQQYAKSELEIKQNVANAYELVLIAQERLKILQKNLESTKKIFNDTKAMFESGFAQQTDVNQVEINLTTLENGIKTAERQVEIAKNLLKFQLNIPLEKDINLTQKLEELVDNINQDEILNTNFDYTQHIDYKVLEVQEKLKTSQWDLERVSFLPTISGFYNHQQSMMSNDFEVFSGGKWYPANIVGLSIQVPIFSSGMKMAKVAQAKIQVDKIENSKQQLSQSLTMQVIQARLQFQNAYSSYLLQKQNKDLSEKIYNDYQVKYTEGMATSLELTQAQLQYLNTESNYYQAIFNLLDAKNKLDKALGL